MVTFKREEPPDWENFQVIGEDRPPDSVWDRIRATICYLLLAVIVSAAAGVLGGLVALYFLWEAADILMNGPADPVLRYTFIIGAGVTGAVVLVIMLVAWFASDWFAKRRVRWPDLWFWWRLWP